MLCLGAARGYTSDVEESPQKTEMARIVNAIKAASKNAGSYDALAALLLRDGVKVSGSALSSWASGTVRSMDVLALARVYAIAGRSMDVDLGVSQTPVTIPSMDAAGLMHRLDRVLTIVERSRIIDLAVTGATEEEFPMAAMADQPGISGWQETHDADDAADAEIRQLTGLRPVGQPATKKRAKS